MARKPEAGIDYFPINTDIIHNPKIKLIVAEFGSQLTWSVILPVYCKIYREKGYWMDWLDEDGKLLFAQDECKAPVADLNKIIEVGLKRSLFNNSLFELYGILTSDRIQENYIVATSRRKGVEMIGEFLIKNENVDVNRQNVNIIDLDVSILTKKVNVGTQSKVKEKDNKKKVDDATAQMYTPEQQTFFKNFKSWLNTNATRVEKMKEPISIEEYLKIKKLWPDMAEPKATFIKMHNWKPLQTKNVSAYLTLLNWLKKDEETSGGGAPAGNLSSAVKEIEDGIKKV